MVRLNKRDLIEYQIPRILIASDASKSGLAAIIPAKPGIIAFRNFTKAEESLSSTERELKAVQHGMRSFAELLEGKHVSWQTDNNAAAIILR